MVQNDKKFCPLHSISQQPCIVWLSFMVHICKMMISSGIFFFFQNFDFLVHTGVKGQKMFQNDKKFCLLHSISQEPYLIWLLFMVQMCKMIISPGVFFNFSIFIFQVVRGIERAKSIPKWQTFLSVAPYISGTIYYMIFICDTHVCIKG